MMRERRSSGRRENDEEKHRRDLRPAGQSTTLAWLFVPFAGAEPPARVYEQKDYGAIIMLPPFPESDRVYDYHLAAVRVTLNLYGIADPTTFAAELQKAG